MDDLQPVGNGNIEVSSKDILLFCCVRNEILRLPYFLRYYRELGVDRFFFVDNGSEDGTKEFLLSQSNVHVFECHGSYAESRCGVDWLNALLHKFGVGHWTLTVDADELLVFPGIECINLRSFSEYLDSKNKQCLPSFLLDMYGEVSIEETNYRRGDSFLDYCKYFDSEGYVFHPIHNIPARGGVRERVFWKGFNRVKPSPVLLKFPFVKWREDLEYVASTHILDNVIFSVDTSILLHFKFFSDFAERIMVEAARKEHWDNAFQYDVYTQVMLCNPALTLANAESVKYSSADQLAKLGLMKRTYDLDEYIKVSSKERDVIQVTEDRQTEIVAGVLILNKAPFEYQRGLRSFLELVDVLFVVYSHTAGTSRTDLVELIGNDFPLVVIDRPALVDLPHVEFIKICENINRFFEFDHFLLCYNCLVVKTRDSLHQELPAFKSDDLIHVLGDLIWSKGDEILRKSKKGVKILTRKKVSELYKSHESEAKLNHVISANYSRDIEGVKMLAGNSFYDIRFWLKSLFDRRSKVQNEGLITTHRKENRNSTNKFYDKKKGIFSSDFHSANLYVDLPPFRYLADKYAPKTVLDLGCGLGAYLKWFSELGSEEVIGIDGFPPSDDLLCDNYIQFDLRDDLQLERKFHLVICVEVIEHIEEKHEDSLLKSISDHGINLIVFSAARPGQPGVGHINCKPTDYWIERWSMLGWKVDPFETAVVRSLSTYHWFRRNLLVLKRKGINFNRSRCVSDVNATFEVEFTPWTNQPAKTYKYPLEDKLPAKLV